MLRSKLGQTKITTHNLPIGWFPHCVTHRSLQNWLGKQSIYLSGQKWLGTREKRHWSGLPQWCSGLVEASKNLGEWGTPVVDKIVCMKNWGAQWLMVLTYRIVASRSTCYYSGNQRFCFLKSRILTCPNIFFRNNTFLFLKIENWNF